MAQINFTLNQEEMQGLLSEDRDGAFRKLLESSLNAILKVESTEQLCAERYERTEERRDSRNGTRERSLQTRIGRVTLEVPRHRNVPFKTLVFDNYKRSEAALITAMAEMVVNGVSSRKVSNVMETLCGATPSKSAVSEACKELDKAVETFRVRPLTEEYPFVMVDATYFKVREEHRITGKAFMTAIGTNRNGTREIIGFGIYSGENRETWRNFLEALKKRGLHGVKMVTSDAHDGIIHAVREVFPEVPWQRCQTHFSRNIIEKTPKKYQADVHAKILRMYHCATIEDAGKVRDEIISEYRDVAEKAMECLEEGFESVMTVMVLPESMRRYFRTSNHVERLNEELKRRSNVIGVFSNDESVIRLMGSVLIEQNEIYTAHSHTNYKREDIEKLDARITDLREIAKNQQRLLKA